MTNSVSLRLAAVRWNGPSGRNSRLGQTQFVRLEREAGILSFRADRWGDSYHTNATAASTYSCNARSEAVPSVSTKIIDFIARCPFPVRQIRIICHSQSFTDNYAKGCLTPSSTLHSPTLF
jgi:hypothetical protein